MAERRCRDVTSSSRPAINTPHSGASTSQDCVREQQAIIIISSVPQIYVLQLEKKPSARMVETMAPASCCKTDARPPLAAAANYAGAPKRRRAFCFHADYVFQSLRHSYCPVLTNLTSSPLMQIRGVSPPKPRFQRQSGRFTVNSSETRLVEDIWGKK